MLFFPVVFLYFQRLHPYPFFFIFPTLLFLHIVFPLSFPPAQSSTQPLLPFPLLVTPPGTIFLCPFSEVVWAEVYLAPAESTCTSSAMIYGSPHSSPCHSESLFASGHRGTSREIGDIKPAPFLSPLSPVSGLPCASRGTFTPVFQLFHHVPRAA